MHTEPASICYFSYERGIKFSTLVLAFLDCFAFILTDFLLYFERESSLADITVITYGN